MRWALLGTRGVPARYGGFETAVEEVGFRLVERGHEIVVYSRGGTERSYKGMHLVQLPAVRQKALETLSHTGLSVAHLAATRASAAIVFNAANAVFVPVLHAAGIPCAVHVDGLEWQRGKWGPMGRRWYRWSERLAVEQADALIADAQGIADYYLSTYDAPTELISYGAPLLPPQDPGLLAGYGVTGSDYHLVVARFEPENNVELMVEGYRRSGARHPLLVVGGAPYADEYTERIRRIADADPRIRLLGPVYDQQLLDALYGCALSYLHGHSVGGTNPSLLRAMGSATAVTAFDVVFNREVLGPTGLFAADAGAVARALDHSEADPAATAARGRAGRDRAAERYDWDDVTDRYEALLLRLSGSAPPRPRARTRERAASGVPASPLPNGPGAPQLATSRP